MMQCKKNFLHEIINFDMFACYWMECKTIFLLLMISFHNTFKYLLQAMEIRAETTMFACYWMAKNPAYYCLLQ